MPAEFEAPAVDSVASKCAVTSQVSYRASTHKGFTFDQSNSNLLATSATFIAKVADWPTTQASGDGRRRPLVTLRGECQASIMTLN